MSTFIVGNGCLDDAVTLRMKVSGKVFSAEEVMKVGQEWKHEMLKFNEDSVEYAYGAGTQMLEGVRPMKPFALSLQSIDQLMQSSICWIYQACDHDDPACEALSDSLEAYIDREYPDRVKREGYKLTEWDRQ